MNFQEDSLEKFYSSVEEGVLLHQLFRPVLKEKSHRINISPASESMQVSHLSLIKNQTFKAHKHIFFNRSMPIAQESWVVISGRVRVFYYDLDDNLKASRILKKGDCTITYRGGHNYESLEKDTIVYEFKTGPYLGLEKDKIFLNDQEKQ
tara:strand:- start:46 stop:495 length:450 start_codon:yes stop_codon:yes gene_type:complete